MKNQTIYADIAKLNKRNHSYNVFLCCFYPADATDPNKSDNNYNEHSIQVHEKSLNNQYKTMKFNKKQ